MSWVRNLLISVGAFWISRATVIPMAWLFGKLTDGMIYHASFPSAIAIGAMNGMGRAVSAAFGAAIVTFCATGKSPQRWALVVALLYVLAARPHYHWVGSPTNLDRLTQSADILWPAVACLSIAAMIGRMRRQHLKAATDNAINDASS